MGVLEKFCYILAQNFRNMRNSTFTVKLASFCCLTLALNLFFINAYGQEDGKDPLQDVFSCNKTDSRTIGEILDQLPAMLQKGYGEIAADSIKAFIERAQLLQQNDRFIIKAKEVAYRADTTSYNTWLRKVFAGAKTKADSIEMLCRWTAENYIIGESETDVSNLQPAEFYEGIRDAKFYGEAGSYTLFIAKVVAANNWGWGVPVVMNSEPNELVKGAGKQPQHTWLGFANDTGLIWCIADPSIGGIVRDTKGNVLTYDTILSWLKKPEKAREVKINPVKFSKQLAGPCVFAVMLRSSNGLEYYKKDDKSPVVTKGEWFTFLEEGSMTASFTATYWKLSGLPIFNSANLYVQLRNCVINSNTPKKFDTLVSKRYNVKVNLTE